MSDFYNNEQNQNTNPEQNMHPNDTQPNSQSANQTSAQASSQPQQQNTASWTSNTGSYAQSQPYTQQPYTANPQMSQPQQQTQQSWGSWSGQSYSPYQNSAAPTQEPKKEKKRSGLGAGLVAALLCVCLLVGAGAGAGGALLVGRLVQQDSGTTNTLSGDDNIHSGSDGTNNTATIQKSGGTQVVVQPTVGIGSAEGAQMTTSQVVAAVKDSVVEITTETVVSGSRFAQYVTSGAGSGVIIAKEGYIITNNHVISGANNITVRTTDGTEYPASVIGTDAASDVAVIKIEPTETLTVATLGDSSKLVVGEDAIVIGNPLGSLGGTVTNGIISALDREVSIDGESMRLLQTNAAVNPGNSGGGLFNLAGELVGIVNAKSSGTDVEGLGFAIPINTAQEIATQLIEYGYVRGRVELGLALIDIDNMFDAMAYNLRTLGVYVYESPYNEEIKPGDRIQSVNGVAVQSRADVKAAYRDCKVGDVITVSVVRGSKVIDVQMTLRESVPTDSGVEFGE